MNSIENQKLKMNDSLDAVSYFQELVKEGFRVSLLDPSQVEKIQYQIADLLVHQFNRYTGGMSSSVPIETGQRIQQSLFYTIGYFLKNLPDEESGLKTLSERALSELYQEGKKLIESDIETAKVLLFSVRGNRLVIDVLAYNDTLDEGLSLFFSSYDVDYGAHETPASIDYPLSCDKMLLTGIEYLSSYLRTLELENKFCSYFPAEDIDALLRGYDPHYRELLFNIYELVLNNAVGSLLLRQDEMKLEISEFDRQYLQKKLSILSPEELNRQVDQAVSRLSAILKITDNDTQKHISKAAVNLKSRLRSTLEANELHQLFLSLKEQPSNPALHFEDNEPLDHDSFRALADEIRECRLISDKIFVLKRQSLSITDWIDLLEGSCFFGKEFLPVFEALSPIQLALLISRIPKEPGETDFYIGEDSKEWHLHIKEFLDQMEPQAREALLHASEQLEFE